MAIKCPRCNRDNPEQTRFCGSCGTRFPTVGGVSVSQTQTQTFQTDRGELAVGSTFARRYLVLEELGRGGMGRVYRVLDTKLDVEIALKLIKPEIASEPHVIERFKNELKLTRIITDKNICRMFDLSEEQGQYYITMEYISGENLKRTIHRVGSLNLGRALAVAKQICDGLAAAHQLEIVHRDLKPQNIMLDQSGTVRIMDFGISRSLRARGITADGIMIGTPEYISPEQAEGSKVDARTDIYSLGAIIFEMVTGKVPFEGDTTLSIILKQKLEPPPDPGKLTPHLPKNISRIILKCLEKDKEKRYASATALYEDLERAESELLTKERATIGREIKEGKAKRGLRPLVVSGIAIALIAVLIGGYFILSGGPKSKDDEAKKIKTAAAVPTPPEPKPQTAPVSEAPQNGTLEIDSVPQGAAVLLNDKPGGITPLKQEIAAGRYELKIRKSPEYKEMSESFSLEAGGKFTKSYALVAVASPYLLEIITTPEAADVLIDGVPKGKTPRVVEIAKNSCQLELRKGEGWAGQTEFVRLNPGKNTIRRTLKQTNELAKLQPAKIRFNVNPYADVFVNDKLVGEIPPIKTVELTEGKYTIKFVSTGLNKTLTVEVELRSGQSKEVRVNMLTGERKIIDL